jgi:hypothetical protein
MVLPHIYLRSVIHGTNSHFWTHKAELKLSGSLPHQQLYKDDIKDKFDLCSLKCKTSSRSVVHQNSFRSPLKNCYGPKEPPLLARARDTLEVADSRDSDAQDQQQQRDVVT